MSTENLPNVEQIRREIAEFKHQKVQPLEKAIADLELQRRGIDQQIAQLRSLIAELKGGASAAPGARGGKTGGKRHRKTKVEALAEVKSLVEKGKLIYDKLAAKRTTRVGADDIRKWIGAGVHPAKAVAAWNAASPDRKIQAEGKARGRSYFVG